MRFDEEELAMKAQILGSDSMRECDAYKWVVYGIKPYYMEPQDGTRVQAELVFCAFYSGSLILGGIYRKKLSRVDISAIF